MVSEKRGVIPLSAALDALDRLLPATYLPSARQQHTSVSAGRLTPLAASVKLVLSVADAEAEPEKYTGADASTPLKVAIRAAMWLPASGSSTLPSLAPAIL